ncbi:hypothetical protein ACU19_07345 [Actinobaculum suis]|nr:hypothetical protein ACU19_07345 [Actinobaculum suis]
MEYLPRTLPVSQFLWRSLFLVLGLAGSIRMWQLSRAKKRGNPAHSQTKSWGPNRKPDPNPNL